MLYISINNCFSWTGYDQNSNKIIEISSGNLVKEGEMIEFYDWKNKENRSGEVREIEYLFNSTRLGIYDVVDSEIYFFDMD
jgi:hypothetical protein